MAVVEAVRVSRALDRHVDAETVALLAEELGDVDGRRVEHGGDPERLGPRASRRVRLRDVDGGGAGRARAERGERADRPGPRDQHPVAGADAGALDAVGGDRRRLDQRALPVASRPSGSRTIWYSATVASSAIPPQAWESPTQAIVAHRCCSPRRQ